MNLGGSLTRQVTDAVECILQPSPSLIIATRLLGSLFINKELLELSFQT